MRGPRREKFWEPVMQEKRCQSACSLKRQNKGSFKKDKKDVQIIPKEISNFNDELLSPTNKNIDSRFSITNSS
jgi:hypothetical protein